MKNPNEPAGADGELTTRIRTGIIEGIVLIAFVVPGLWVPFIPVVLFSFITFMMALEKAKAVNLRMAEVRWIPVSILSVVFGLAAFFGILRSTFVRGLPIELVKKVDTMLALRIIGSYALVAVFLLPLLGLPRLWKRGAEELPAAIEGTWIIFSSSLPLASAIALLYGYPIGWHWFVLAILTTAVSDIASYFAGKAIGRLKMAPKLSPNKTWEGTLAGILVTIILYLIYIPLFVGKLLGFSTGGSLAFAVVAAILMSSVSTAGDLLNSAMKRWCGIKDFGKALPGHGGFSDRFDSLSAVVPAMFVAATLAQLLSLS